MTQAEVVDLRLGLLVESRYSLPPDASKGLRPRVHTKNIPELSLIGTCKRFKIF